MNLKSQSEIEIVFCLLWNKNTIILDAFDQYCAYQISILQNQLYEPQSFYIDLNYFENLNLFIYIKQNGKYLGNFKFLTPGYGVHPVIHGKNFNHGRNKLSLDLANKDLSFEFQPKSASNISIEFLYEHFWFNPQDKWGYIKEKFRYRKIPFFLKDEPKPEGIKLFF